jgi:hypothetical protein
VTTRPPIARVFLGGPELIGPNNRHGFRCPVESAEFGAFIDTTAATVIANAREAGAGSVIVWDAEGYSRNPYLGSPNQIPADVLPHLRRMVRKFHAAKLDTGFTLRPAICTATHWQEVPDVAPLVFKARWCKGVFGDRCRMHYVDSDWLLLFPTANTQPPRLADLTQACPGVTFISEHAQTAEHSQAFAIYQQQGYLKHNHLGTPPAIRATNPRAWSAINLASTGVPTREDNAELFDGCVAAIRQGDTLFFNAWYGGQAGRVAAVYAAARGDA